MIPATLYVGEMLDVLRSMPDASVDAVISDVPYGLSEHPQRKVIQALSLWLAGEREFVPGGHGFMKRQWDSFVPPPAAFDEIARVVRPGGHVAIFAHARTQDLMALSARLAGLELRDTLAWVQSQGMPKGTNLARFTDRVGEQYRGYASQLKPGYEPILLFRAPLDGSVVSTVERHGTGALNIDGCRTGWSSEADQREATVKNQHARFGSKPPANSILGDASMLERTDYDSPGGRWPANIIFDEEAAAELDEQSGITQSYKGKPRSGVRAESDVYGENRSGFNGQGGPEYDDIGGASRFFYCAKVRKSDRLVLPDGTFHVSVKPSALMDWVVKLLMPPAQPDRDLVVLDPFSGTSTTLEAAAKAGHRAIGVERDPGSVALSQLRFERAQLPLQVDWGHTSES